MSVFPTIYNQLKLQLVNIHIYSADKSVFQHLDRNIERSIEQLFSDFISLYLQVLNQIKRTFKNRIDKWLNVIKSIGDYFLIFQDKLQILCSFHFLRLNYWQSSKTGQKTHQSANLFWIRSLIHFLFDFYVRNYSHCMKIQIMELVHCWKNNIFEKLF